VFSVLGNRKIFALALLAVFAFAAFLPMGAVALAQGEADGIPVSPADGAADTPESLKDRVNQHGDTALAEQIDNICAKIVGFIRGIFSVLAVVFVIWAGFAAWGAAGDPVKIALAKRMAAGFIVCLICVYSAERIVGGILGLLGYQAQ